MIKATGLQQAYQTILSTDKHQILADMKLDKGGQEAGMGPHEILEAAMAACMSITLRMVCEKFQLDVGQTSLTVDLDRSEETTARFRYHIDFDVTVPQEQRQRLIDALGRCPVSKTIARQIVMEAV